MNSKMDMKVKPAKEFIPESEHVYRNESNPRGLALVINNRDFLNEDTREGSERDYLNITNLMRELNYEVIDFQNITAEVIQNVVYNFADLPQHNEVDSCIVVISSHGRNGDHILGTGGYQVNLEKDIIPLFNNKNCPALVNKPKLFFFQACRGDDTDEGVQVDGSASAPCFPMEDKAFINSLTTWSDMIIMHSTIPGYVSNRHPEKGSWFVQSIVETFREHACDTDLETMLKMVTNSVIGHRNQDDEMQAPEMTLRGWTKSLYFNPGY